MFVSTVVSSRMINADASMGVQPHNFSLPYNFTRGRNIVVNISHLATYIACTAINATSNILNPNSLYVSIPIDVNVYTTTMQVVGTYAYNNVSHLRRYNLEITFNITLGIITITPISVEGGHGYQDVAHASPILISFSTIL